MQSKFVKDGNMTLEKKRAKYDQIRALYPEKFASENSIFQRIHRGDRIFLHTGCGEPQYLIKTLVEFVKRNPKALFDAEIFHVWTLGVAPYTDSQFSENFRHNSFFIGDTTRKIVNKGLADYTPIFLSNTPGVFYSGLVPLDVALIQCSGPDDHGYLNLGVSVDIVKAAIESASLVIAQLNTWVPRVHGDGFIHIEDLDYVIPFDEPILEYDPTPNSDVSHAKVSTKIGNYVSRLIQDGDTIQVGYGSIPDAVMANLSDKKYLGVHTELISDGLVDLMKKGIIDNSQKTINRGKTIGSFCMGKNETYEFLDDNPSVELRRIDYTNNPMVIAQNNNMTAINSALQIDLTGQASAESIGSIFYSGIGGQADFMRGAMLAKGGKTILTLQSTAENGTVSRIVPFITEGGGVTLNRGDIHYVVTEYGIAYLHGKNIRERAMHLISIAHPKFRPELIKKAKKYNLIFRNQAFVPGKKGDYPEHLEVWRTTKEGLEILLRPVKISDESLLKDFFYDLSDRSLYRRFMTARKHMPHERLQDFCIIDFSKEMVIVAAIKKEPIEKIVGVSQYAINQSSHSAEVAFVIRDKYQNLGVGTEMLNYLTYLAKRSGLLGFTAEVLLENKTMIHLFEKMFPQLGKRIIHDICQLKMSFIE